MAYDDGDITDREETAAENQNALADYNRSTLKETSAYNEMTTNQLNDYNVKVAKQVAGFNQRNANDLAKFNKNNATTLRDYNRATAQNAANYTNATQNALAKYNRNTAKTLADYNAGLQKKIANNNVSNTTDIAKHNANAVKSQINQQLANYDFANRQNASLRDTQLKQASRKSETERFEAQRQLQNAALGLLGGMNQAMNGSTIGNTMRMLENRNDSDNTNYWQQLADNRNAVLNAYDESYNQNQVAKLDAIVNARKALRDIQGDLSANLNNIQGDLSANLGTINSDLLSNLSSVDSDLYMNLRNAENDRYTNRRSANADWFNNYNSIEGDRFSNYNNAEIEMLNNIWNTRADTFKELRQLWGDRFTNMRNLEGDLAANLNNINPNLYEDPDDHAGLYNNMVLENNGRAWGKSISSGKKTDPYPLPSLPGSYTKPSAIGANPTTLGAAPNIPAESLNNNIKLANGYSIPKALQTIAEIENNSIYRRPDQNKDLNTIYNYIDALSKNVAQNKSRLDDYIMPANAEQNVRGKRNTLRGGDYFSNLINGFN